MTEENSSHARAILSAYPGFQVQSLCVNEEGQNNEVVLVNDDTIFRFPRHESGIYSLRTETCVLHALRPHISLPIPEPRYYALDTAVTGTAFTGYPALPGEPLLRERYAALQLPVRRAIASRLAAFLQEIHAVPAEVVRVCGVDTAPPRDQWQALYTRMVDKLVPHMEVLARKWMHTHFERGLADLDWDTIPAVPIHGDLGGSNILINPSGEVTGIIDFGSAHLDDPAVDYAAASTIGPDMLSLMTASHPEIGPASDRIAFYRGTFALQYALFGAETGDEEIVRDGLTRVPPR